MCGSRKFHQRGDGGSSSDNVFFHDLIIYFLFIFLVDEVRGDPNSIKNGHHQLMMAQY